MRMTRFACSLGTGIALATLVGCTQPKETTAIGAAAGGALGAGLGAIIGSQTGDAGSGLVIGALAGSAGGGLVGNAFQAQEESIQSQNEAIQRQEEMLAAQREEMRELRRINSDVVAEKRAALRSRGPDPVAAPASASSAPRLQSPREDPTGRDIRAGLGSPSHRSGIAERDIRAELTVPAAPVEPRAEKIAPVASLKSQPELLSAACGEAEGEFASARRAAEQPDKLFHLRRALRLCPENPSYHHELGLVYLSLGRNADAEYEFNQALSLDPHHKPSRSSLNSIRGKSQRF